MQDRPRRTLNDLSPGERAVICRICHMGGIGQRLMALGILPGCPLTLLRAAPLGDPLMMETAHGVFCLRRREAALVEIEA